MMMIEIIHEIDLSEGKEGSKEVTKSSDPDDNDNLNVNVNDDAECEEQDGIVQIAARTPCKSANVKHNNAVHQEPPPPWA